MHLRRCERSTNSSAGRFQSLGVILQNDGMSPKFRRVVTLVVLFGFVATGLVAALATK